jgi:hypothetical protein
MEANMLCNEILGGDNNEEPTDDAVESDRCDDEEEDDADWESVDSNEEVDDPSAGTNSEKICAFFNEKAYKFQR